MLSVSVITPTTGNPDLLRAVESVQRQNYTDLRHVIVFDGTERLIKARPMAAKIAALPQCTVASVPFPTGLDGYLGHRIYAAWPFLLPSDAVVFLDEDNWFEPNHIASLAAILDKGADWSYALRRIFDNDGNYVCNDDCQSLGGWPVHNRPEEHMVDTNCYMIRRALACTLAPVWNRPSRKKEPGIGRSTALPMADEGCAGVRNHRLYTVNYTAGNSDLSAPVDYFLKGNKRMQKRFPDGFPWSH